MSPEVESYIKQEQAKVKVEPYDDAVLNQTFKGRTFGLWAGVGMGLVTGLAAGALAWPLLATALTHFGIGFGTLVAACGVAGSAAGATAGQIIGAPAAAAAAAAAEREKRDKQEIVRERLLATPGIEDIAQQAMQSPTELPQEKANSLEELHKQKGGFVKTLLSLVNPKVLFTAAGLGAALGAILGSQGPKWLGGLIDFGTQSVGQNMLAGALLVGISSMTFGFNFPILFTSASRMAKKIISGAIFENSPAPALEPEKAPALAAAPEKQPERQPDVQHTEMAYMFESKDNSVSGKGFVSYSQRISQQQESPETALVIR